MRLWIDDRVASIARRRIQALAGGEATALGSLNNVAASDVTQRMSSLVRRIKISRRFVGIFVASGPVLSKAMATNV